MTVYICVTRSARADDAVHERGLMAGQLRGRAGDDCVTSHIEQSLCTSRFVVVSQSGPRRPHAYLQHQNGLSNRSVGSAEAWRGYPDWRAQPG
ncbi:hypothetical protein J6590_096208 [Homalodisca vitripennis]|nr:hypothetical protein J6590_096208 [Homalodisca vitripennis]